MFKIRKRCNAASLVNRVGISYLVCFIQFLRGPLSCCCFMESLALCIIIFSHIYVCYCVCFVHWISMDGILRSLEGACYYYLSVVCLPLSSFPSLKSSTCVELSLDAHE